MAQQLAGRLQKPTEFKYVTFKYVTQHSGRTAYLSDLVRTADSKQVFESNYFDLGLALQDIVSKDPSLFVPLDSHIYEMIKAGKKAEYEATGSVLLIPGDKGLVNPIVEPRIKIKHPTWTHYGISHKLEGTPQNPKIIITDEAKLVETNLPLDCTKTVYPRRIENGTLMEVQDKPHPDFPRNVVWIDSRYKKEFDREAYDFGINPLERGSYLVRRERVSCWDLGWHPSYSLWRSRLGIVESRETDRIQQFRSMLNAITTQRLDQLPAYVRNLQEEFDQLAQKL